MHCEFQDSSFSFENSCLWPSLFGICTCMYRCIYVCVCGVGYPGCISLCLGQCRAVWSNQLFFFLGQSYRSFNRPGHSGVTELLHTVGHHCELSRQYTLRIVRTLEKGHLDKQDTETSTDNQSGHFLLPHVYMTTYMLFPCIFHLLIQFILLIRLFNPWGKCSRIPL